MSYRENVERAKRHHLWIVRAGEYALVYRGRPRQLWGSRVDNGQGAGIWGDKPLSFWRFDLAQLGSFGARLEQGVLVRLLIYPSRRGNATVRPSPNYNNVVLSFHGVGNGGFSVCRRGFVTWTGVPFTRYATWVTVALGGMR